MNQIRQLPRRALGRLARHPRIRRRLEAVSDRLIELLLATRPRNAEGLSQDRCAEIEASTEAFNEAAERYFADYPDPHFIKGKPFSEEELFAKRLFDMSILFHWSRINHGDVVLELGAGTCWLSHFLNQFGCHTISVDVSKTALEMGREVFASSSKTRWDLDPQFLTYDGRHLPVGDESCDAVILNDAFHHIPNPRQMLSEMARVLRPNGVVAMAEPGRHHSKSVDSQREMDETGVLENDVVVEQLADWAQESGFAKTTVVPITLQETREIGAHDLAAFMRGRGLRSYWRRLNDALDNEHYVLFYKSEWVRTTRRPGVLAARLRMLEPTTEGLVAVAGDPTPAIFEVRNTGDTRWLAQADRGRGCTMFGAHLCDVTDPARVIDLDWFRHALPHDLEPGSSVRLDARLPPIEHPGAYHLRFDVVVEDFAWLEQKGSPTLDIPLTVSAR